jgi:hypothetical protein
MRAHQGALCTFEVLLRRFRIADGAASLGRIVRDIDLRDSAITTPGATTVVRLWKGCARHTKTMSNYCRTASQSLKHCIDPHQGNRSAAAYTPAHSG